MKSCFTCHKAGDIGIDFGPALTEIGDKLAREAMYLSIIKPSQAISFGYEGFNIKTKNGLALIGYITSDSDKELVVRVPGGALIPTAKSDILAKTAIKGSLMPEGLVSTMTENELVDLVEYLMTLKKSS
jgi:putative heme-binding domain-containing protein